MSNTQCQKLDCLNKYYDMSLVIVGNTVSLIHYNSLQSQLLFDALYYKIDQLVIELSIKTLT